MQTYGTYGGGTVTLPATTDPAKLAMRARLYGTAVPTSQQVESNYQSNYRLGYGQPSLAPQYAPPATLSQRVGVDVPQRVYQGVEAPYQGGTKLGGLVNAAGALVSLPVQALNSVGNLASSFWNNYIRSKNIANNQGDTGEQMFY
jgi:hypothetical protein